MEPTPADPIWNSIVEETTTLAASEPMLASFLHATILNHARLEDALSYHLSRKLGGTTHLGSVLERDRQRDADEDQDDFADPVQGIAARSPGRQRPQAVPLEDSWHVTATSTRSGRSCPGTYRAVWSWPASS